MSLGQDLVAPHRRFVGEEVVAVHGETLTVFLFNDILLLATRKHRKRRAKGKNPGGSNYTEKQRVVLEGIAMSDGLGTGG